MRDTPAVIPPFEANLISWNALFKPRILLVVPNLTNCIRGQIPYSTIYRTVSAKLWAYAVIDFRLSLHYLLISKTSVPLVTKQFRQSQIHDFVLNIAFFGPGIGTCSISNLATLCSSLTFNFFVPLFIQGLHTLFPDFSGIASYESIYLGKKIILYSYVCSNTCRVLFLII